MGLDEVHGHNTMRRWVVRRLTAHFMRRNKGEPDTLLSSVRVLRAFLLRLK